MPGEGWTLETLRQHLESRIGEGERIEQARLEVQKEMAAEQRAAVDRTRAILTSAEQRMTLRIDALEGRVETAERAVERMIGRAMAVAAIGVAVGAATVAVLAAILRAAGL